MFFFSKYDITFNSLKNVIFLILSFVCLCQTLEKEYLKLLKINLVIGLHLYFNIQFNSQKLRRVAALRHFNTRAFRRSTKINKIKAIAMSRVDNKNVVFSLYCIICPLISKCRFFVSIVCIINDNDINFLAVSKVCLIELKKKSMNRKLSFVESIRNF